MSVKLLGILHIITEKFKFVKKKKIVSLVYYLQIQQKNLRIQYNYMLNDVIPSCFSAFFIENH